MNIKKKILGNTPNHLSKFRTKKWIEINDQSRGVYNVNGDIRFKTTTLKSSLCDYSDAYILVKGRITITGTGADVATRQADKRNKGVIFENCAPFKDVDIVMPMYNLIEYSDNYSKISASLWQYYKVEPNYNLKDSESFKSKIKKKNRKNSC